VGEILPAAVRMGGDVMQPLPNYFGHLLYLALSMSVTRVSKFFGRKYVIAVR